MAIEGIGGAAGGLSTFGLRQPEGIGARPGTGATGGGTGVETTFAASLEAALAEVGEAVAVGDQKSIALVTGEDVAVHDVMASVTEAEIAVQLTTAIAAKAIQAYQEIWRMEI